MVGKVWFNSICIWVGQHGRGLAGCLLMGIPWQGEKADNYNFNRTHTQCYSFSKYSSFKSFLDNF